MAKEKSLLFIQLFLGCLIFSKRLPLGYSLFFLVQLPPPFHSPLICCTPTCFLYTKKLRPPWTSFPSIHNMNS